MTSINHKLFFALLLIHNNNLKLFFMVIRIELHFYPFEVQMALLFHVISLICFINLQKEKRTKSQKYWSLIIYDSLI